ncbi:M23 family metallopeptidase [Microlunatus flavus]|uniref:Murein DD-endopeptidase MepM and murein hydrolase activator NlpD, contain LysM domain n=1 Tax=Microlunatus flavus TaxID=1036181 RepID=A0A1H9MB50_9ACTN|nr:M23 family metallopeptidase [Microlunatus flavus]SER20687.1 Murein DD-endopeptidase MepM and murein hydrolase activator NlpD, contain LysM domain [Microlunatus flavus]
MSSTAVLHRASAHGWSESRTLATNTILALLIAVAGLLAASSLSLTSRADTTAARPARVQAEAADPGTAARRSAALQSALLAEVAAQRGDALARNATSIARASLSEAGTARQQQLTAAQAAVSAEAAKIAQQRLEAAIAARQAAVDAGVVTGTAPDPNVDPTLSGQALTPVTATSGTLPAGTHGVLPIASGVVGSKFGATGSWATYHTGLDFRAAYGTPIHSVLGGTVVFAGSSGDWSGTHVAVRHADGRTTMYSHMSRLAVTTGQTVQTGQVLGYVGQTGRAFGAHLHFELYPVGVRYGDVYKAVDPAPFLRSIGLQTR